MGSIHETPELTTDSGKPDVEPPRSGCSCLAAGLYGIFLLIALAVMGVTALEQYVKRNVLKSKSPAKRAAFEKWLNGSFEIPPHVLQPLPPQAEEIVKQKQLLLDQAEREYERWDPITDNILKPRHSIVDAMQTSSPLTSEQLTLVTTVTAAFPAMLKRAQVLIANPDYVLNDREYPPLHVNGRGASYFIRMASIYAWLQLESGQPVEAAGIIDTVFQFTRFDPGAGFSYPAYSYSIIREAGDLAAAMTERTTDTVALRNYLQMMNKHTTWVLSIGTEYNFIGESVNSRRHMIADGYLQNPSYVRRNFLVVPYEEKQFLQWLSTRVPGSTSRYQNIELQLAEYLSYGNHLVPKPLREYIPSSLLRPLSDVVERASMEREMYWYWESQESQKKYWSNYTNRYNTARLQLAQRIAQLNGDPIPTAPEDFVPRYLPVFPADVRTSKPLAVPPPPQNQLTELTASTRTRQRETK